jgi:hypothetical protein
VTIGREAGEKREKGRKETKRKGGREDCEGNEEGGARYVKKNGRMSKKYMEKKDTEKDGRRKAKERGKNKEEGTAETKN